MSKHWKPGKKTVELQPAARPSRIRRDPVRLLEKVEAKPASPEREAWATAGGVVLFGLVCTALILGISEITSHGKAAAAAETAKFAQCYDGGADCVVDGDTIHLAGEEVAIAGMDAPEIRGAACREERSLGILAAVRLADLINGGQVTLAAVEREPDGRVLRHVEVDGRDVAGSMIAAGVARPYGAGPLSWCSD